jgi:DNA replication protein DnaC
VPASCGLTDVQLLILDDWGHERLGAGVRSDLYETLEERSTILTSQIPVDKWHAFIGDIHNAHRIDLAGDSLRPRRSRSASLGLARARTIPSSQ